MEIWVSFKSEIELNEETVVNEFTSLGELNEEGNSLRLNFEEPGYEGFEDSVNSEIIIQPEYVVLSRSGAVQMQQSFVKGQLSDGIYDTPFGRLQTLARTHDVEYDWNTQEKQGHLHFQYDFFMNDEPAGNFDVTVEFRK